MNKLFGSIVAVFSLVAAGCAVTETDPYTGETSKYHFCPVRPMHSAVFHNPTNLTILVQDQWQRSRGTVIEPRRHATRDIYMSSSARDVCYTITGFEGGLPAQGGVEIGSYTVHVGLNRDGTCAPVYITEDMFDRYAGRRGYGEREAVRRLETEEREARRRLELEEREADRDWQRQQRQENPEVIRQGRRI